MTIHDASDYIIMKLDEAGVPLNVLKLQKLVYYVQAWYLAFYGRTLFPGRFQAWIHGPVNRDLYDRFAATKGLYSLVLHSDMRNTFNPEELHQADRAHIDAVLQSYADFSGDQLEELTHNEDPWVLARAGYAPNQRCEVNIDEHVMQAFYSARAKD